MVFLNEYMPGAFLNDLQLFDPAKVAWTDITSNAKGDPPSPRRSMGFTADGKGMLYVFGGTDDSGKYNIQVLHPCATSTVHNLQLSLFPDSDTECQSFLTMHDTYQCPYFHISLT